MSKKHKFYKHDRLFAAGSTFNFKQTGTNYATDFIEVAGFTEMCISLRIVQTGAGTVGQTKVAVQLFDDDAGTTQMSESLDICTAISTNQGAGTTKYSTIHIGPCLPDPVGINSGTMPAGAGAKLQGAKKLKITVIPTAASDAATSCVGTLNVGVTF
jgi:hypothetical protein